MQTLFNGIYFILVKILSLVLPHSSGLPAGMKTAFIWAVDILYNFSAILPVADIIDVLILLFIFESGMLAWRFTRFVLNLVRGSGG